MTAGPAGKACQAVSGERHAAALAKANLLPVQRPRPGVNDCHNSVTGLLGERFSQRGDGLRADWSWSSSQLPVKWGRIQLPVASAGELVVKFCFPLDVVLGGFDQGLVELRGD
jgi:hypothetical protein